MEKQEKIETQAVPLQFVVDEVVTLKGSLFKVVLFDPFTDKICLKLISRGEAEWLKRQPSPGV